MRNILLIAGAVALAMLPAAVAAEDVPVKAPAGYAPQMADTPFSTSTSVTAGATALAGPGRAVVTTCTGAGNAVIVHKDGSTVTVAVAVGTSYWPEAAVQIASAGTTATCTYWIER